MKQPSLCFVSPFAYSLFTGDARGFGGAEVQQRLIGCALADLGYDVRYVSYTPGPPREEQIGNVRFWTIPPPKVTGASRYFGLPQLALWRALRWADADVYYQRCAGSATGIVGAFAKFNRT